MKHLLSRDKWEEEAEDALLQAWHDEVWEVPQQWETLQHFKDDMYKRYTDSWIDLNGDNDE